MQPPLVSVIVVTWNSQPLLASCVRAIPTALGQLLGEVIIIDNASTDGTAAAARSAAASQNLTVMALERNYGFAAANNRGIRQARGEYVLLLNPDTELAPGAIAALVQCARQHQAAIVGAHHRHADGTTQPSVRRDPTLRAMALVLLKVHRFLPRLEPLERYGAADFDYHTTQPVEQVAGSCLLISRTAIEKIGLLDEHYYLWFEEVDWCRRARQAGLSVWYCRQAAVKHFGAQSFSQLSALSRQWQFDRSLRYYFRKHQHWLAWVVLALLTPFSLLLAWISQCTVPRTPPMVKK